MMTSHVYVCVCEYQKSVTDTGCLVGGTRVVTDATFVLNLNSTVMDQLLMLFTKTLAVNA